MWQYVEQQWNSNVQNNDENGMTWHGNEIRMTMRWEWQWDENDESAHQACELCEEVAEVIGGVKSEPRHAVAENQTWAQHQLGKILKLK